MERTLIHAVEHSLEFVLNQGATIDLETNEEIESPFGLDIKPVLFVQPYYEYRLFVGSMNATDTVEGSQAWHNLIMNLDPLITPEEKRTIVIHITSNGGNIRELDELKSAIVGFDHITTYVPSFAGSAAALLFLIGEKRIIQETAQLMFHQASLLVTNSNTTQLTQTASSLEEVNRYLLRMIKESGVLSKKQLKQYGAGIDVYVDAKQLAKRGACTHVMMNSGDLLTAKEFLKQRRNEK